MADRADFDASVALPPGLEAGQIRRAVEFIEREASDLVDIYYEQKNVFSAIVSILGTRALDSFSSYERHKNVHTAQQQFPDLKRRGSGDPPAANDSLESKASIRPWALQAHYDHPGWYVVWRYLVDATESIEPGVSVVVWRVDVAFLTQDDWKYEGSTAGSRGGGRTHTFGIRNPATRFRDCAVYRRPGIRIRDGKPVPENGA